MNFNIQNITNLSILELGFLVALFMIIHSIINTIIMYIEYIMAKRRYYQTLKQMEDLINKYNKKQQ